MSLVFTRPINVSKSSHCKDRQRTRFIADDEIDFACSFGTRVRLEEAVVFSVLQKDIPEWLDQTWAARVKGLTVITSAYDSTVLTAYRAYRNTSGHRALKKHCLTGLHRLDTREWHQPKIGGRQ